MAQARTDPYSMGIFGGLVIPPTEDGCKLNTNVLKGQGGVFWGFKVHQSRRLILQAQAKMSSSDVINSC